MTTRRQFLGTAAALVAGACARARGVAPAVTVPAGRLPIAFSTLGAPTWSWTRVLDFAVEHAYSAIELRGLDGEMDLSKRPEFSAARVAESRRQLAERQLRVVGLGASTNMHETDPARRAAGLDEARRYVELAQALGAPYVRVFGNNWVRGEAREATLARVATALRELGEHARARGVTVLLESHGDFTDSPTLVELMRRADSPGVALLWDAHHTYAFSREDPDATARQLMPWVRHTHLKDSLPPAAPNPARPQDRRYVLTGRGEIPVRRQFEALARHGYRGYYSFEWEKRWHPEIEEPEVALAHFAQVAREYLRAAGVAAG